MARSPLLKIGHSFRRIHKILSLAAAAPLLIIFSTGLALSISPKFSALQPPAAATAAAGLTIPFERVLQAAREVPAAGIRSWDDVAQIDARPAAGLIRVRSRSHWEIQIDGNNGRVVSAAPRLKTLLILLHDGSWFAPWVKSWIFFPAGVAALALWISGLALWLIPIFKKRGTT